MSSFLPLSFCSFSFKLNVLVVIVSINVAVIVVTIVFVIVTITAKLIVVTEFKKDIREFKQLERQCTARKHTPW